MTTRLIKVAAAAVLLPAFVFAQSQVEVVNGERGMIFKDTPSTLTRAQVRAELNAGASSGETHFKYVGGEAGWAHESPSHRMVVRDGKLAHAADCPVMASINAPKTTPAGAGDYGYTGA
jgi:hypothetical protein